MTRLPPRPLLDPAMIAKNWIFCPGRGTLPELLLLCSDVDVVRLRRGLGEGEGAAETGAKECWSSRAAQLGWRLRRPRPAIVITASHSAAAAAAAARRGPALAWRNHQVGAAAVAGNSNKELVWLVEVVCTVQWCGLAVCLIVCSSCYRELDDEVLIELHATRQPGQRHCQSRGADIKYFVSPDQIFSTEFPWSLVCLDR